MRGGREEKLIEIFRQNRIGIEDYVFGYWDSHELALLKGVPREELKQAIMEGKSISLCFPERKILCSGMVGSLMGTAVGVAWAFNQKQKKGRVFIFCGDMSSDQITPRILIRVAAGPYKPVHPGHQHIGNYAEGFRKMFPWIEVMELNEPEDIFPAYKHALEREDNRATLLIEHGNFYNEK